MLGLGQLLQTQAIIPGKGRQLQREAASRRKEQVDTNFMIDNGLP